MRKWVIALIGATSLFAGCSTTSGTTPAVSTSETTTPTSTSSSVTPTTLSKEESPLPAWAENCQGEHAHAQYKQHVDPQYNPNLDQDGNGIACE